MKFRSVGYVQVLDAVEEDQGDDEEGDDDDDDDKKENADDDDDEEGEEEDNRDLPAEKQDRTPKKEKTKAAQAESQEK